MLISSSLPTGVNQNTNIPINTSFSVLDDAFNLLISAVRSLNFVSSTDSVCFNRQLSC